MKTNCSQLLVPKLRIRLNPNSDYALRELTKKKQLNIKFSTEGTKNDSILLPDFGFNKLMDHFCLSIDKVEFCANFQSNDGKWEPISLRFLFANIRRWRSLPLRVPHHWYKFEAYTHSQGDGQRRPLFHERQPVWSFKITREIVVFLCK